MLVAFLVLTVAVGALIGAAALLLRRSPVQVEPPTPAEPPRPPLHLVHSRG